MHTMLSITDVSEESKEFIRSTVKAANKNIDDFL